MEKELLNQILSKVEETFSDQLDGKSSLLNQNVEGNITDTPSYAIKEKITGKMYENINRIEGNILQGEGIKNSKRERIDRKKAETPGIKLF